MLPALFAALALTGHTVTWLAIVNRTHAYAWHRRLVDALTFACGVALAALPAWAAWEFARGGWPAITASGPLVAYGAAMIAVAAAAAVHHAWRRLHPERRGALLAKQTRRHDFRAELGLGVAAPVPRWFCRLPRNEVLSLSIEEIEVGVPGLPDALAGLKIALLADLHISGRFGIELYQRIIAHANAWRPDLIALAGDLIEKDRCTPWVADTYGRLTAPLGVCFVLGNHDKKCDHAAVRRAMAATGAVDVGRVSTLVTHNGQAIEIAGNELPWFGPPARFTAGDGAFRLLIAHGPDQFFWAIDHRVNLMVAGHNHGGQVRFPPLGPVLTPSRHGTRYACGTFRRGDTVMHVTRGTGSLAPFRYFCPPELTLIKLAPAPRTA